MADKAVFRAQWKIREREMTQQHRLESDFALQNNFLALPQLYQAQTVLLYDSMGFEVGTRSILRELIHLGKRVLLPRCLPCHQMEARAYEEGKLARHKYGMWEPTEDCALVNKRDIDLILVPALCYDRQRFRMGRGGGFYDRYLADYHGLTVGLCRGVMLQREVPRDDWDVRVDLVLTEEELI